MDDLTKGFLVHWQKTHPGGTIKYFDASEPVHISQFNSIDDPTFPSKTLYKDFPHKKGFSMNDYARNEVQKAIARELQKALPDVPIFIGMPGQTNDRDTHFENAAKLLVEKTMATRAMDTVDADRFLDDDDKAELQMLFAQFAYDVARHVVNETMGGTPNAITLILNSYVSDLTQWPETSEQLDTSPPH